VCPGALDRGETLAAHQRQGGTGGIREPEVGGGGEERLLQNPQAGGSEYYT